MRFNCIILSLAALTVIGCGGSVGNQNTVDDLNYKIADLKASSEKAELKLAELESTNSKLEEQNKKLLLLKKKMEINAEYIEELRNSAFEIKPPDDLKIVKLGQNAVAQDAPPSNRAKLKKYSSMPKETGEKETVVEKAIEEIAKRTEPVEEVEETAPVEEAAPEEVAEVEVTAPVEVTTPVEEASPDTSKPVRVAHASPQELAGSAETIYQRGLDANYAGDFVKAREIFASLLEQYPKHSLADNALYWSGETYFSAKEYQKAIKKFTEVVKLYPKENKTPDALLKAGFSFVELEKPENAKKILERLIALYPDSEAAGKAKSKLVELK
ncbi:MAG: tol-pal system protein YbgF [Thermodesulfobacteriota bacterium]